MAVPLNKLQQRVFKVFYRDYQNAETVASTSPNSMLSMAIPELADQVLQHADSFIGIIDASDTILLMYLDDDETQVTMEVVFPNDSDGYSEIFDYQSALCKINELPAQFDIDWLREE